MAIRNAKTDWTGGLNDGSGVVELVSSGVGHFDVSFPRRSAEEAEGVTSPEELIAAAHSACYAMQCSALIARAGGTPGTLSVSADVNLEPDPAGGFRIAGIHLSVRGVMEGIDEVAFKEVAEAAKSGCPVSKAMTGTVITLDAAFA
ncbi:MAG: OsmC family peroxiredoxin [Acidimicrobiaceae bacterium]|nr:OsmC family peroxiredoxin [Acidimicrobiaceae bacterium]